MESENLQSSLINLTPTSQKSHFQNYWQAYLLSLVFFIIITGYIFAVIDQGIILTSIYSLLACLPSVIIIFYIQKKSLVDDFKQSIHNIMKFAFYIGMFFFVLFYGLIALLRGSYSVLQDVTIFLIITPVMGAVSVLIACIIAKLIYAKSSAYTVIISILILIIVFIYTTYFKYFS